MRYLYVVMYHHRYGTDAWPVINSSGKEPDLEKEASKLQDFEPDREEYLEVYGLEVYGPWPLKDDKIVKPTRKDSTKG